MGGWIPGNKGPLEAEVASHRGKGLRSDQPGEKKDWNSLLLGLSVFLYGSLFISHTLDTLCVPPPSFFKKTRAGRIWAPTHSVD